MSNFIEISQLSKQQIEQLIERALHFKQQRTYPAYPQHPVALLFHENSTRTRVSFEMAARQLSMPVIHLDMQQSSESKGETVEDTLRNLAAMGIHHVVMRHKESGLPQRMADHLGALMHIVNAGDGTHAHPSQAILDMMTIVEPKPCLSELKIAVLGNITHSRVANSFLHVCSKMGVGELVFIAPALWQPTHVHFGRITHDIHDGLADADVVMCLRVQRERLQENEQLDLAAYRRDFALTQKKLAVARPDVMVMHPGPINRGVEIDNNVADGAHSFILKQVTNGVFARMAILESLE